MSNAYVGTARSVAKSDTSDDSFNLVMVQVAGTLVVDQLFGKQITLTTVVAGTWIPVGNAIRVRLASTATGITVV